MTTGKIERLGGADAFILKSPGILSSDILVVIDRSQAPQGGKQQAGSAAPVLKKGEKVQVKGRVEELAIARIEERYKPGLEAELREELQQKQAILVVPPNGIQVQGVPTCLFSQCWGTALQITFSWKSRLKNKSAQTENGRISSNTPSKMHSKTIIITN